MDIPPVNLLQASRFPSTPSWQRCEITLWSHSIRTTLATAMAIGTGIRLLRVTVESAEQWSLSVMGLVLTAFLASIGLLRGKGTPGPWEELKNSIYLFFCQVYCVVMVLFVFPNYFSLWCVNSTMVFCMFEIPSFRRWWTVLLLLVRQFSMWQCLAVYLEGSAASTQFPYYMITAILVMFLLFANECRKRTIDWYQICKSIEEQEVKMKEILQAIPEGLAVITGDISVPCFNSKISVILQQKSVATAIDTLVCSDSEGQTKTMSLLAQVREFIRTLEATAETFGVTKSDQRFYEWKGTKCVWGDSVACILTASDITSWVDIQERLKKESEAKTALLRFVSHELRTPTNAIINLVANVKSAENIQEEQKVDLEMVIASTHFLLSVINDLLDFSRIVADKFTLVKQTFDIRRELLDTVQLIELQCAQKQLFLTTKIDDFVSPVIFSDPNRFKQVLLNLLGNAIKFTFKGGIRVICNTSDYGCLKVTVKDTGIGIPPEKISCLFKLFGTVEGTQRINPQGSGLGLYISNFLAKSLGGRPIKIESKVGVGSEFSFFVSIFQKEDENCESRQDSTTDIQDERDAEATVLYSSVSGGKGSSSESLPEVLIVDDSDFNRVVLSKLLSSLQVSSESAVTGLHALSLIRAYSRRGHCFRLILMDIEMPEMDGVTATEEIRAMEVAGLLTARSMVIACSAHRSEEYRDRCVRAGMDGFLEKPISRDKLCELVESVGWLPASC